MAMTVKYMDHLASVHELEVLVVSIMGNDPVLGKPWFEIRKPEIDWATGRFTSLRTPSGQGEARRSGMMVQWYKGRDDRSPNVRRPVIGGCTPTSKLTSEIPMDPDRQPMEWSEDSPTPEIEILGDTAFDNFSASDETIETFALRIRECRGMLGATIEVTTLEGPGGIETVNPKGWTS